MIEQAIFMAKDSGFASLARSPGFGDELRPLAESICSGFGTPRADGACPGCVFARPLGRQHVAVVQATGRGTDGAIPLAFRFLLVPKTLYADLQGDLFRIAEAFPPAWEARGDLPVLTWTAGPPHRRTIADIQKILNVPYSATLLGGVQALLDGGRLVFERTSPDERLVRSLWSLLPASNRCELWPTTFAFGNAHGFDVAVVPRADGPEYSGYVVEVQAGDYPQGRYELALQIAAESDNQEELDALFARRSRRQTFRIGLILLALFIAVPLLNVFCDPPAAPPTTEKKETKDRDKPPKDEQRGP